MPNHFQMEVLIFNYAEILAEKFPYRFCHGKHLFFIDLNRYPNGITPLKIGIVNPSHIVFREYFD